MDKRPLDLYRLKKAVEVRGGFDKVCKLKKWAEIGRDLGYSGKIMSSLSTSLKNSYQRWLSPYEDYLRVAKPGVQQQLEHEYGGPLTPSPADSPVKKSQQSTPGGPRDASAARHASAALDASIRDAREVDASPRPVPPFGFTPVNLSGFTAVKSPAPSFTAVNASNGVKRPAERDRASPRPSGDSPPSSSKNTPEYRPSGLSGTSNGTPTNHLKRKLSPEEMERASSSSRKDHGDLANGDPEGGERRSKRLKKGTYPGSRDQPLQWGGGGGGGTSRLANAGSAEAAHMVAGSYMTLLRPSTPWTPGESGAGKPGEVSGSRPRPEKGPRGPPSPPLLTPSCRSAKRAGNGKIRHRWCSATAATTATTTIVWILR